MIFFLNLISLFPLASVVTSSSVLLNIFVFHEEPPPPLRPLWIQGPGSSRCPGLDALNAGFIAPVSGEKPMLKGCRNTVTGKGVWRIPLGQRETAKKAGGGRAGGGRLLAGWEGGGGC